MSKVIAIIPARGGSKGLSGKNRRLLDGKPLISYPIRAAKDSGVVDHIFCSTDSEEIAEAAREHGAEVPFLRPVEMAEDKTTTEQTLRQALLQYEEYHDVKFDICVYLTATDLFRDPEWTREAVSTLIERPDLESVFVGKMDVKNFWEELPDGSFQRVRAYMQEYGQRQERIRNKRVVYREDTGLTCASRAWLWRMGKRIGDKVKIIPNLDSAADIDIHSELDLMLAEHIMQYRKKKGVKNGKAP